MCQMAFRGGWIPADPRVVQICTVVPELYRKVQYRRFLENLHRRSSSGYVSLDPPKHQKTVCVGVETQTEVQCGPEAQPEYTGLRLASLRTGE